MIIKIFDRDSKQFVYFDTKDEIIESNDVNIMINNDDIIIKLKEYKSRYDPEVKTTNGKDTYISNGS